MKRYENCRKFVDKIHSRYDRSAVSLFLATYRNTTAQFSQLQEVYADWNSKIKPSHKDIVNLNERHVLHSLAIAKILLFRQGTSVLEIGTVVVFRNSTCRVVFRSTFSPDQFHRQENQSSLRSVDSHWAEKYYVCTIVAVKMRKKNSIFVVSRAVMPLNDLVKMVQKNITTKQINALPNGLICLKGKQLEHEILPFRKDVSVYDLSDYFTETFFETKKKESICRYTVK